jgi:flavin reductase (DIM6/NTAB) family NADH-FMN oxidoreductase RutF
METNLTPVKSEHVDAPYVEEFPSIMECKLHEIIEISGRIKVVGEIVDVKVDEDKLTDGVPDLRKLQSLVFCSSTKTYNTPGEFLGKSYTNPKPLRRAD